MDFPNLQNVRILAVDTESTGLGAGDRVFGVSVAFEGFSGYWDTRIAPQVLAWLRDASRDSGRVFVAHNASFDYRMLYRSGLSLPLNQMEDTSIRACLIDENLHSYSLDDLAAKYLGARKIAEIYDQLAQRFGGRATRNVQMPNLHRAPAEWVAPYARRDAELAYKLYMWQEGEIRRQGIEDICAFERSVMPAIIRAEMRGIRVDVDAAALAQKALSIQIDQAQKALDELCGKPVNVNSSPQVKALFNPKKTKAGWVTDRGDPLGSTPAGAASIDAETLRTLESDPRARLILDVRSGIKTRDTFLGGHVIASAYRGRVYPSINQTRGETAGTRTGRLSYSNPAMQQIPSRNKQIAAVVKPVFLPDAGHIWVDSDLSSFEVRIFAHLVNDPKICQLFRDNIKTDFHQAVADMTGLPRNASYPGQPNSKQLNLAMIFNSGNGAIAEKMGMPYTHEHFVAEDGEEVHYRKAGAEAQAVIDAYHASLPGVKGLASRASEVAKSRGYIHTRFGRRIRFPDPRFAYKASGLLIQATSADLNKAFLVGLDHICQDSGGHLILNTHDSYSLSLPEDQVKKVWTRATEFLRDEFNWLNVPLLLELSGGGENWWSALNDEAGLLEKL
jgi:DNA polymerase I-like protein with 3'-5' exonuclease and polymerase domains